MKMNLLKKGTLSALLFVVISSQALIFSFASPALAQTDEEKQNPNSSFFRIVVCDGPKLPDNYPNKPANYVPCDFVGLMKQVQHLITLMLIVGVLAAIVMTTYAGYLYISGSEDNMKKARSIFPKLFWGFVLMLTAWFIVFQILSWLTDNNGFKTLLGNP
jgi:hypothetical protein